jgi:hypothetical protein
MCSPAGWAKPSASSTDGPAREAILFFLFFFLQLIGRLPSGTARHAGTLGECQWAKSTAPPNEGPSSRAN